MKGGAAVDLGAGFDKLSPNGGFDQTNNAFTRFT